MAQLLFINVDIFFSFFSVFFMSAEFQAFATFVDVFFPSEHPIYCLGIVFPYEILSILSSTSHFIAIIFIVFVRLYYFIKIFSVRCKKLESFVAFVCTVHFSQRTILSSALCPVVVRNLSFDREKNHLDCTDLMFVHFYIAASFVSMTQNLQF